MDPMKASDAPAPSRRARRVAVVMIATMGAWLGLQWLGAALGLPPALAIALDLAALVAFGWALTETWRIRRADRNDEG